MSANDLRDQTAGGRVSDEARFADKRDSHSKPDSIESMLSHLLRGELRIGQDTLNAFAAKALSGTKDSNVRSVAFSLSDGFVRIAAQLEGAPQRLGATLSLEGFCFEPGQHSLTFRLQSIDDLELRGRLGTLISPLVLLIADSVVGKKMLLRQASRFAESDFLSCTDDLILCNLDNIEQFSRAINAEVGVGPLKIRPFNHVRIRNITIKDQAVVLTPQVKLRGTKQGGVQATNDPGELFNDENKEGLNLSEQDKFAQHYSEKGLIDKVGKVAKDAGLKVIYAALLLFYVLKEGDVPAKTKGIIYAALGYFIFPMDAIADVVPVVGYADDIGVLLLALAACTMYIDDNVKAKARAKLRDWFGEVHEEDLIALEEQIS